MKCLYLGDKASPLDPSNKNCHSLTIIDTKQNGKRDTFLTWSANADSKIRTPKEIITAFGRLVHTAMIGGTAPLQFCKIMQIDPEDKRSELLFLKCRDITQRLTEVVKENPLKVILELKKQGIEV